MPDLNFFESYKGLDVVPSARAADEATSALTDNFATLADRAPYESTSDPTSSDNESDGFNAGDLWLNTSTNTLWTCISSTSSSATWQSLYSRTTTELKLIPDETTDAVDVAGYLKVSGMSGGKVALDVNTPGTTVWLRTTGDNENMQVLIDGSEPASPAPSPATNKSSSFQLRNGDSASANRTIFTRLFQHHSAFADSFRIQHVVGSVNVCIVEMTNTGGFEVDPKDDVIFNGNSMGNFGIGTAGPKAKLHSTDSTILGVDTSAIGDSDIGNGEMNIYVDEANDELYFKVKYSNGTVKTGTVGLS